MITEKETRQRQSKFDAEFVKKEIRKLIPEGFEQERMENGRFISETKWKAGVLKKVMIDEQDVTAKIDQAKVAGAIINVLKMSNKFRRFYTGTIKFTVTIENGEIAAIHFLSGSWIIDRRNNRYFKQQNQK